MQAWFPTGEPICGRGSCVPDLTFYWPLRVGAGLEWELGSCHAERSPIALLYTTALVTSERSKQRRKWTLLWLWPPDSQLWIPCSNLASCQHYGLYNYSQIESAPLLHNIFTPLTFSELILLHENSLSSDASVQLPCSQSGYFLDTSRLQIALDHQLFVQDIPLYTFLSIGEFGSNFPGSFIEFSHQSYSIIFIWKLCVFIGRDKGFLSLLQSIICTIHAWYS